MKKVVTVVLIFVLALSLGGIVAFAEKPVEARCFYGTNNGWVCDYQNLGCAFGNGCLSNYCGNYGTGVDMSGYVSERPVVPMQTAPRVLTPRNLPWNLGN